MFSKRSLILIGVLLFALPITAAEFWVAPAIDPPDTEVGDWAVTGGGSTHFSFALPGDLLALTSVKVVVIGKKNKETLADVYLSIAPNGERYDFFTASILGDTITHQSDVLMEVDVTSVFPIDEELNPGVDYVSLYFSTRFARVVGLRFSYEGVVADALAAETAAREDADDALEVLIELEEAGRIAGDAVVQSNLNDEATARASFDAQVPTIIGARVDSHSSDSTAHHDHIPVEKTGYVSVPLAWWGDVDGLGSQEVPVFLPHGATIKGITWSWRDENVTEDAVVYLMHFYVDIVHGAPIVVFSTEGDSGDWTNRSIPAMAGLVVNNQYYAYVVRTSGVPPEVYIRGLSIEYTYTEFP